MTVNPPVVKRPILATTTIIPENKDLFIPYLNRLYEDIASAVNSKDYSFFTIPVTNTASNIPNLPNFGSYVVCVSGQTSGLPCLTIALNKASNAAVGIVSVLGSQAGTVGAWVGATLTVTATATNFQINHSVAATTGNFNIRIIGTQ
jgi:hypothetical protein